MASSELFDLGDILAITTGKLTCPIERVYGILAYLTGESPYTHQLGRFMDECRPHLLRQHPELADVDASAVNPETWRAWLEAQKVKFGGALAVARIPRDDHAVRDPIEELRAMIPGKAIIVLDPETGEVSDGQ